MERRNIIFSFLLDGGVKRLSIVQDGQVSQMVSTADLGQGMHSYLSKRCQVTPVVVQGRKGSTDTKLSFKDLSESWTVRFRFKAEPFNGFGKNMD